MARLFGYPINIEEEGNGGGGSSTNAEVSRSATQPNREAANLPAAFLPRRETNPYPRFSGSGSSPMDSEPDLHNSFIDFFGRESREIETAGAFDAGRNQMQRITASDLMEVDEEIELGLGIGAGSGQVRGDAVTGDKETDSGRGEVGVDLNNHFEDDREEEAMLMADGDVLLWENLQNDIAEAVEEAVEELEQEEAEEELEQEEEPEEEEEEVSEVTLPPVNNDGLGEDIDDIMMGLFEGVMDEDYEDFLALLSVNYGDYHNIFPQQQQPFNQHPPPPSPPTVIGTRPASKRAVDDLPVVEITSEELSSGRIVCAVCIGDVVAREKVNRLPCGHYYHGGCIVPWLEVKNTCPVCRYELPTDDLEYERKRRSQRL